MEESQQVAIFWDYENCAAPSSLTGYELVKRIREVAHELGTIKSFRAYTGLSEQNSPRSIALRSELQSSGVSIIDCPHNGYKNVADQMMIVDMLTFAMDSPNPSRTTILLISGDRDFCYAVSVLRLRLYSVAVIAPPNVHPSLQAQVSRLYDWIRVVTGREIRENRPPYPRQTRGRHRSGDTSSTIPSSPSNIIPAHASQGTRIFPSAFNHSDNPRESPNPLPSSHHTSIPFCTADGSSVPPYSISSCVDSGSSVRLPHSNQTLPARSAITADMLLGKTSSIASPRCSIGNRSLRASNGTCEVPDALQSPFNCSLTTPPAMSHTDPASNNDSTSVAVPPPSALDCESRSTKSAPSPISSPDPSVSSCSRPRSAGPSLSGTGMINGAAPDGPQTAVAGTVQREAIIDSLDVSDVDRRPSDIGSIPIPASVMLSSTQAERRASSTNIDIDTSSSKDDSTRGTESSPPHAGCLSQSKASFLLAPQTKPLQSLPVVSADAPSGTIQAPATVAPPAMVAATTPAPAPPAPSAPKVIPEGFLSLLRYLENIRLKGTPRPLRSAVSLALANADKQTYQRAGCKKWTDFAVKAESLGLISLGGEGGKAWIGLHPDLHGRIELKSS